MQQLAIKIPDTVVQTDLLIDSRLALVDVLGAQGAVAAVLLLDLLWCVYFLEPPPAEVEEDCPPPALLDVVAVPSLLSNVVFLSSIWSSPLFLSRKFSNDAVRRRLGRTGALDLRATLMYL